MPQLKSREYRQILSDINMSDDESYIVEGYAMTWDRYLLFDGEQQIYEKFDRSCFSNTDMSDVILQYDHQGKVFARTSNNTLQLSLDDVGLHIRADLSKSQASRDLYEEIKNGLTSKMSWGFATGDYHFDRATQTIIHTRIKKIYDVSAVSIPANDGTSINARSELLDEQIEAIKQELAEEQQRNKVKLQLRLKLEGF